MVIIRPNAIPGLSRYKVIIVTEKQIGKYSQGVSESNPELSLTPELIEIVNYLSILIKKSTQIFTFS